jgi:hypothetical protein
MKDARRNVEISLDNFHEIIETSLMLEGDIIVITQLSGDNK